MIIKLNNKQRGRILTVATILSLLTITMIVTVFGDANLSGTIAVKGLSASSTGATDWEASAGGASWTGKTTSSGGCSPTYTPTDGTLVFTNGSEETKVLSFDYTVDLQDGSLTIDDASVTSNGSFSKTLANGASVTLVANSAANAANTTKITLSNIKLEVQEVTITFAPSTNGSYTVNGSAITTDTNMTGLSTTTYSLVATPADNYHFAGWYLGDVKVYESATVTNASFATSGVVTAKFVMDPIYAITTTPDDSYTVDQIVAIDSQHYHDSNSSIEGKYSGEDRCYYGIISATGAADDFRIQRVPTLFWSNINNQVSVSYSGTSIGESGGALSRSWAYSNIVSNVIRIFAKEDCIISFDYSANCSGGTTNTATLYVYETTVASATFANVKTNGTAYTSDVSITHTLAKGKYLYIVTKGYSVKEERKVAGGETSMSFSYSATLSGFTVERNESQNTQTTIFQDNTGVALSGGKLTVGTTTYTANANGQVDGLTFPTGQTVKLAIGAAPTNYRFIGWSVNGSQSLIVAPTYEYILDADTTINPIFVPDQVTFDATTGTYKYLNISGSTVALNGQFVARNTTATVFYTSLADAFAANSEVVLLGNMTIDGNYQIPAGKTLIASCDMQKVPTKDDSGVYTPIYEYLHPIKTTLIVNGSIAVNGTLIVNGYQNPSNGSIYTYYATMKLNQGSTITVNDGGALYGYGVISGTGSVTVKNGAQVHEFCEVLDVFHPFVMKDLADKSTTYRVLPFNTYFINNIEAKCIYEAGAKLDAHISFKYDAISQTSMRFIGASDALFVISEGTITKYFDTTDGQIVFSVDPGANVESGSIQTSVEGTLGVTISVDINTGDYYLPIGAGYQIQIAGDFTVNHLFKFLPGSKVNVTETGTLTIGSNGSMVFYRLNDYDYRANASTNTEALGFSTKGCALSVSRHSGYYSISTIGSAKLNVDGILNANGGLYVTNQLIEENTETDTTLAYRNYKHYSNGYNFLSGTGTINMGSRTYITTINENLTNHQDKTTHITTVAVVPMKGLICTNKEEYTSLSGTVVGVEESTGVFIWHAKGETVTENQVDATCGTAGSYDSVLKCATCANAIKTEVVMIPATGAHSYTIESCDREFCWNECVCGLTDTKVKRDYTLIFTDYFGKITEKNVNYGDVSILTISTSNIFELSHAGWKINGAGNALASDALWNAFTIDASTTELNVTEATTPTAIKSGAISATLQYNNAGDLVITLHVSADPNVGINNANAFNLSILYQGNTIDNIELAASSASMYMYKGTVTIPASALGSAQEIRVMLDDTSSADVEEHLSKTIDDVLIAYVEALKNTSVSGSLASQQNLATNMLYYANAVYNYFYGDHVFSETTAFPDINASDYATGNGPTSVSAGGSDTASASFKGAIVNFERKSSLHLYYTLTLPTGSAIVKQGVIEFDQAPGALSGKFTGQDGGTFYPYYKTDKNGDFAATDKKGVDQLGDHYYTVYVEYTCEGETHYLYGQTMQYGISRYLRSQIYKYCPAEIGGKGTLLSAADQAIAQQKTMEYVNLLYSMLQVYNATQELQANASVEATQ